MHVAHAANEAAPIPEIATEPPVGVPGELTLPEAIGLALLKNPELASTELDIRIAEAKALQAGLRKNPDLSLEVEDIRWSRGPSLRSRSSTLQSTGTGITSTHDAAVEQGAAPGLGESQATLRLSQVVELGGKRVKRMRLAEKTRDLARWSYEAKRLDVLTAATKAFVETLSQQEKLALAQKNVETARQVVEAVAARVEAGKVSPIEASKAETQLAATDIAFNKEQRLLETARARLAAEWGAETPEFERVVGDLYATAPVPDYAELERTIAKNPDVARWADEMEMRDAALAEQRALRVPDLTVEVGLRTLGLQKHEQRGFMAGTDGTAGVSRGDSRPDSTREDSMVLMFSMPLPIFDRNQGGILEAEKEAEKAGHERRNANAQVHLALQTAHHALTQAAFAKDKLEREMLPRARETFDRTQEGYQEGKFGYLDVLDAQKTLYEITAQYLDALTDYHTAVAELERLSGVSSALPENK